MEELFRLMAERGTAGQISPGGSRGPQQLGGERDAPRPHRELELLVGQVGWARSP